MSKAQAIQSEDKEFLAYTSRFLRLIDSLPGIVFSGSNDAQWSMQYLSRGCLALTGYSSDELAQKGGEAFNAITHPEDLPRVLATLSAAIASSEPYEVEYRIRTKSGEEKWVLEKGHRVLDEDQCTCGIEGFITDITPLKRAEAALIQAEARWRSLIHNSSDLITILDAQGTVLYHSPVLKRLLGYHPQNCEGKSAFGLVHPQDRKQVQQTFQQAITHTEFTLTVEYRFRHQDGSWRFLESTGRNLLADPAVAGIVVNTRDITDHKRTESALRQAEEKYRSIFENAVEGIFQSSPEGRYIRVNPALARMYGYDSPEELLAHLTDIGRQLYVDPERRAEFQRLIDQQTIVTHFEAQVYRRDGSIIWITEHARAVRDGTGKLLYYEGTVENITDRKRTELQLLQTTSELKAIFQALPDLYFRVDHDSTILDFKAGRRTDLYLEPEEFLGRRMTDVLPPPVATQFSGAIDRILSGEARVDLEYVLPMPDGEQTFEARLLPLLQTQIIAVIRNITKRKRAENELRQAEEKYRSIFENATEGIFQSSPSGSYISANPALARIYGYDSPQELQHHLTDIGRQLYVNPDRRQQFVHSILEQGQVTDFESQVYRKDGSVIWISENARAVRDRQGNILYFEGTVEDISARKQAELTIHYQAFHDLLTGLPNRALFDDRLNQALADARRYQHLLAVFFLDLDRFKVINDTLGHAIGDQLLQQVAQRLLPCLREIDTIARWGGDEFTLLLPHVQTPADSVKIAERLLASLKPPFSLKGHNLHITASLGIALYPHDGEDGTTLLRNADAALYRAKEEGRNGLYCYTPMLNSRGHELLALESELHKALEQQELDVYYQPQINAATGEILRLEALVRWQHSQLGLVSPQTFIGLAEENGLIMPIGQWVLETACHQCRQWQARGFPGLGTAVNLSVRQFQQPHLVQQVAETLQYTGLAADRLELEITETTAMQNVNLTRTLLHELDQMGVGIALDDFGSGYSSLNYLRQFPLHSIKIDRTFIQELPYSVQDQAIVKAVIALGRGLNLSVVAEGVESQSQLKVLRSLGCDIIQGYFFGPPIAAAAMTQLLEQCTCSESGQPLLPQPKAILH
uniref:Diguanylate cyclase/phosphodiesterase with PAS/PAC sensor(S) n=1 Tax=Cyanothece sp. (strain PCC 7425 / ATCC 29141) TaxID=395961 RepID=B8HP13_CYAP4